MLEEKKEEEIEAAMRIYHESDYVGILRGHNVRKVKSRNNSPRGEISHRADPSSPLIEFRYCGFES